MKRTIYIILILFCVGLMSSCTSRAHSSVVVAGSTSVQPYVEILAEEYAIAYPDAMVDVQGGGSSAGITAVETGVADVGMSSRALKESEERLWSVVIAKDGLALIVHPDNPIDNLSLRQVLDIYTGRVTNWNELGGEDKKIHLVAREEGSGTRSAFQDLVMADESITPKAIVQNTNGAVKQFVSGNPNAIGFISLGLVDEQVKALYLDGVSPTQINVLNGSYGLFRPFLFVSNYEPEGQVKKFIDYVLSDEGQQVLIDEGLVSLREGAGE